jgi:hypothetical protein
MKKLIGLASMLVFVFETLAFSQSEFQDAKRLSGCLNRQGKFDLKTGEKEPTFIKILRKYVPEENTLNDSELKEKLYSANPFLRDFIETGGALGEEAKTAKESTPAGILREDLLKRLGGYDVSLIADGLAKLLVERTKQELNAAFFVDFQRELAKEKYADLRFLFPATFRLFQMIGTEIYRYGYYLLSLKDAFERDLHDIFLRLSLLLEEEPYKTFFTKKPYLYGLFSLSFSVIKGLLDEKHPGLILEELKLDDWDTKQNKSYKNLWSSLRLLQLISKSLQSDGTSGYWTSPEDIESFLSDGGQKKFFNFKIYLGLIYQGSDKIEFIANGRTKTFRNVLDSIHKTFDDDDGHAVSYSHFFENFAIRAQAVERLIRDPQKKSDIHEFIRYYDAVLDLFEEVTKIEDLPFASDMEISPLAGKWLFLARTLADVHSDVKQKSYFSVPLRIANIYDIVFPPDEIKSYEGQNVELPEKDKIRLRATRLIRSRILKYGSFIASVALAENSDQIKAALDSAVLPVGSSAIKKNSPFSIALNSFVGIYVGNEHLKDLPEENKINSVGVIAPIGFAVSTKLNFIGFGSLSLFGSFLDLGAITAYRFRDSKAEKLPELTLSNIVAPGAYGILGLKKYPISFGLGAQYGPQLRAIKSDEGKADIKTSAWRFNFFIAVDIPLLNVLAI